MQKPLITVENIENMSPDQAAEVAGMMNAHGCVQIIQSGRKSDPVTSLRILGQRFGKPIFHKLSDPYGIHPIRYIPGYPEYANANVEELGLHTDGSFEQIPPAVMMIHCEIPAALGGDSTLASGEMLYHHLRISFPDYLLALQLPNAFTIIRDDRSAERAVFTRIGERLRIAYRSGNDVRINIHPDAVDAFEYVRKWLLDGDNFMQFKLASGDTLIFDNTRMLHGRTAFERTDRRTLHGLWCDGSMCGQNNIVLGIEP